VNILFRCDGSVEIGMGHVIRCLALADHLKENHDCKINFAMRKSELGISKVKDSYPVLESNEESFNYVAWLTSCIDQSNAEILIMDMRDGLTKEQLQEIKKRTGIKVVTIDDPEDKRLEANLAFYSPIPQLEKMNWTKFKGDLYVGWEFVILRKEFLIKYPKSDNKKTNILVSMGGTDENNMMELVINSLRTINEIFKATIIVGSGYPYLEQLKKTLEEVHFEFELYQNPKNIAEVMSTTSCAIISFGQTAYELAALNIPALYLCLTNDHEDSAQLFVKEGIGKLLGIYSDVKHHEIVEAITHLLIENEVIEKMSNCAKSLNNSSLNKISQLILKERFYA
jgi:UDP-2,4-diacetamido-2,4,6-trideoxy-beta-L-altropyranose hydrolase